MNISKLLRVCVLSCAAWFMIGSTPAAPAEEARADRGKEIFEHVWDRAESPTGDGLGPMYNERSCLACHFQGGAGGAGPNDKSVDLLTAIPPKDVKPDQYVDSLLRVHVGFSSGISIVLHRYSTSDAYAPFRATLLETPAPTGESIRRLGMLSAAIQTQKQVPQRLVVSQGIMLMLTQRSTTPLFGAGAIDSIPDKLLVDIARLQHEEDPQVSGRVVGKFGWRGQVRSLTEFVLGACAVEIGLEVPSRPQAIDPTGISAVRSRRANRDPQGVDLTAADCNHLISYVASLPVPRRIRPRDPDDAYKIRHGEEHFGTIGCITCHRATVGEVEHLYSDLLVHDMGAQLEDPAPAPTFASSEYYGPALDLRRSLATAPERRREWRTPPLWGLRDSAPYLHDGRAESIEEAILWHGGEAARSRERFLALNPIERAEVLQFLASLAAPLPDKPATNAQRNPSGKAAARKIANL